MRRRKPTLITLFVIAFLVTVGALAAKVRQSAREDTAIRLAQEYLQEKYPQEMEYRSIRFSWIDPGLYHVSFVPTDLPEVCFDVLVQSDLTIQADDESQDRSADNYYIKYFEHCMETRLSEPVQALWGETSSVTVLHTNYGLYSFSVPPEFDCAMPLSEMDGLMADYQIYLNTPDILSEPTSQDAAANKLFEFMEALKAFGFHPKTISYRFNSSSSVLFENWSDFNSPDEVLSALTAHLQT